MVPTSEVIESYKQYLEVKYPIHFGAFCSRLKGHLRSAKAEAVVFSILRSKLRPKRMSEIRSASMFTQGF